MSLSFVLLSAVMLAEPEAVASPASDPQIVAERLQERYRRKHVGFAGELQFFPGTKLTRLNMPAVARADPGLYQATHKSTVATTSNRETNRRDGKNRLFTSVAVFRGPCDSISLGRPVSRPCDLDRSDRGRRTD
jgi:hypothetical protein